MWIFPRLTSIAMLAVLASPLPAQDVVVLAGKEGSAGQTRISGEVLEFTGQSLIVRTAGGNELAYPGNRVIAIETTRSSNQTGADGLFNQRQYGPALTQYRLALGGERRPFLRREILAQIVWCQRELGDIPSAVQYFQALMESDPATRHFDCIPLAWTPGEPPPTLEPIARQWLTQQASPVNSLIGASHLLTSSQQAAALGQLKSLSFDSDPRIAGLARAQGWRVSFAASEQQLDTWAHEMERLPEPLRAGPYYVLGRALAYKQQPAKAATALMRVPILFPRERTLGARAMVEAARELQHLGQSAEASSLYRELMREFPGTPVASEAQSRLQELAGKKP